MNIGYNPKIRKMKYKKNNRLIVREDNHQQLGLIGKQVAWPI
jgi:hypothetical protein